MEAAEIATGKQEAEAVLAEAIPALMEAEAALNSIKRDDITEIRSFAKPHILVQQARQASVAPARSYGTASLTIALQSLLGASRFERASR